MTKLYGSLEAGGTKFVCAVGDENFKRCRKNAISQQQLQSKQSIKPLSSSRNSIILLVLQLVHLVRLILTKTQKLMALSQRLQNQTGQMWTCLVPFVVPLTCQCTSQPT